MTDLAARLVEALDRAFDCAEAAGEQSWAIEHHECDSACDDRCEWKAACAAGTCGHAVIDGRDIRIYDEGGHDAGQAAHIVAWQPAQVRRLIVRDRFVLQRHVPVATACGYCLQPWPCPDVDAVAMFWLSEVPSA